MYVCMHVCMCSDSLLEISLFRAGKLAAVAVESMAYAGSGDVLKARIYLFYFII
jgi:hypothetical protein